MQDRVPTPGQEGRVLITPENGGTPFYATISMADNPSVEGTPWAVLSVLQDATAALFGLGTDAVPDDVFAFLGKYAQHWWRRRTTGSTEYTISYDLNTENTGYVFGKGARYSRYYVADEIYVDDNGNISLLNPVETEDISAPDTAEEAAEKANTYLIGKYFVPSFFNGGIPEDRQKTPLKMQGEVTSDNFALSGTYFVFTANSVIAPKAVAGVTPPGEWEYVQSSDRSAYPDSGEQDGYEYQYLGVPLENAVNVPKIETGSYTGTGTYGSNNPNSLTLGFEPKVVLINASSTSISSDYNGILISGGNYGLVFRNIRIDDTSGMVLGCSLEFSDTGVSWYNIDSSIYQLNESGTTYTYTAFG